MVLDPAGLVPPECLEHVGETVIVSDWWGLRAVWEREGRGRSWSGERMVIHVIGDVGELPYDIRTRAGTVEVDFPVPPNSRELFRSLIPDAAADIVIRAAHQGSGARTVVESLLGVAIPVGSPSGELAAVASLRARPAISDAVWELVRSTVTTSLAVGLATQPPDTAEIVSRWTAWLSEGNDDDVLRDAGPALLGLVTSGMLPRVAGMDASAPSWARLADSGVDGVRRAEALLRENPVAHEPASLADWSAIAAWMGSIRGLLSLEPAAAQELHAQVLPEALALDVAFARWLQQNYGSLLQSAASPPTTVHKIAPFLARRLSDGVPRVLLVVLDGVGFAQWQVILQETGLAPLQQHACVAMLPTETAISRQALIAGTTPDDFAESLRTTAKEEQRWSDFWGANGLSPPESDYHRVDGVLGDSIPLTDLTRAVAVVVSAVDKAMHGSELLGDVQLAASVSAWCQQGFLSELLARAADLGFESWLTADHGNVVASPGGAPPEGLKVDKAGTRFRLYHSKELRDASADVGIAWTPPRLPADINVLFARGREGFHRHGIRVTHGGLSFEEVFVPFARMT